MKPQIVPQSLVGSAPCPGPGPLIALFWLFRWAADDGRLNQALVKCTICLN